MFEREKFIKLIETLNEKSLSYFSFLKGQLPGKILSPRLQIQRDAKMIAFSEILDILKSRQPLEDFIDKKYTDQYFIEEDFIDKMFTDQGPIEEDFLDES
jgi:hypothetical protein